MHDDERRLRSLQRLAGGTAHDLNNLLMSVTGNAELALLDTPADSPARECIEDIVEAASRAVQRCNELMVYAGRRPLRIVPADAVAMARAALERTGLEIDLQAEADSLGVDADVGRLDALLDAVLDNAVEAAAGGTVAMAVRVVARGREELDGAWPGWRRDPGSYVCIEVRDEGPGMDADTLEQLFEPYFSTSAGRRGLGLAWAPGLLDAHGGAIEVRSAPGDGTVVAVLLPVRG
jgi:signal transduction histidine kinase